MVVWENGQALIMTLEWKTYVWFLVWKCHDHIYLQFSKKLLFFFAKWKAVWWRMHEFPSFFLDFLFVSIKTIYAHFIFYTFQSPFFSAVFWAPIFLVYQAISLCIKYIASVMIRCASAHTHILQKFYFFFPLLSLSFQLVTNWID